MGEQGFQGQAVALRAEAADDAGGNIRDERAAAEFFARKDIGEMHLHHG